MVFSANFALIAAAALVVSAIGFKKYVWFISIGYGFSIAAEGLVMLVRYGDTLDLGCALLAALFVVYGCRLGGYLAVREFKSASYQKHMTNEVKDGKGMPFGVKCALWITCAALYVTQVAAVFYRMDNGVGADLWSYIGAAVMAFGVGFESLADIQKNRAKKLNPRRFVDTGLYRIVRCPNYLGEMLFWTGSVLSGVGALTGAQWVVALIGYVGIIFVMFSGARRLELRQDRNYGDDPEYLAYKNSVPIMVPFVPLYSVKKYKFLVA
ncbi:MAG: DUF1295 domain-containing protein [Oscillospiraceae bacterium]|nr:DUF1295 domain-containing protein [Oscillospiraceae bacterium]